MSNTPKEESRENTAPSPKNSHESKVRVFRYMAILFAAAFLLLLLAFLMQNRASQEAISDLTKSVSSVHNVVEENAALRQQVEELNKTYLEEVSAHQKVVYDNLANRELPLAMDYFWQLEQAYLRGQYSLCRELIEKLEQPCDYKDAPISSHLLTQNYFDSENPSMAERYQQICDALD